MHVLPHCIRCAQFQHYPRSMLIVSTRLCTAASYFENVFSQTKIYMLAWMHNFHWRSVLKTHTFILNQKDGFFWLTLIQMCNGHCLHRKRTEIPFWPHQHLRLIFTVDIDKSKSGKKCPTHNNRFVVSPPSIKQLSREWNTIQTIRLIAKHFTFEISQNRTWNKDSIGIVMSFFGFFSVATSCWGNVPTNQTNAKGHGSSGGQWGNQI